MAVPVGGLGGGGSEVCSGMSETAMLLGSVTAAVVVVPSLVSLRASFRWMEARLDRFTPTIQPTFAIPSPRESSVSNIPFVHASFS